MAAAARAAERNAQRRASARRRYLAAVQHATELGQAEQAVSDYEEYVSSLVSIHKEGSAAIDWQARAVRPAPNPPGAIHTSETEARQALESYRPGLLARSFRFAERRRQRLELEVEGARGRDAAANVAAEQEFQGRLLAHFDERELAERLLAADSAALVEVIEELDPFSDIKAIGSSVEFRATETLQIEAELRVHGEECIPKFKLSLLKSGRASCQATARLTP